MVIHQDMYTPQLMVRIEIIIIIIITIISKGGTSWTKTTLSQSYWWSIASDSTGNYLAVVEEYNSVVVGPWTSSDG